MAGKILTKWISETKLAIADVEGMFSQRLDIVLEPFTGPIAHLFPSLTAKMEESKDSLRKEIREKAKL